MTDCLLLKDDMQFHLLVFDCHDIPYCVTWFWCNSDSFLRLTAFCSRMTCNFFISIWLRDIPHCITWFWCNSYGFIRLSDKNDVRFFLSAFDCQEPPPPTNGGKVCQTWQHGSFCSVSCFPSYQFVELPPPFYTCGKLGFWDPPRGNPFRFPPCTCKSCNLKRNEAYGLFFSHSIFSDVLLIHWITKCVMEWCLESVFNVFGQYSVINSLNNWIWNGMWPRLCFFLSPFTVMCLINKVLLIHWIMNYLLLTLATTKFYKKKKKGST